MGVELYYGHNRSGQAAAPDTTAIIPEEINPSNQAIFLIDLGDFSFNADGNGKVNFVENGIKNTVGNFTCPAGKEPLLINRNGRFGLRFNQFSGLKSQYNAQPLNGNSGMTLFLVAQDTGGHYTYGSSYVNFMDTAYGHNNNFFTRWWSGNTLGTGVDSRSDGLEFSAWQEDTTAIYLHKDIEPYHLGAGTKYTGTEYTLDINLGTFRNFEAGIDGDIMFAYAVWGIVPDAEFLAIREKLRDRFDLRFKFDKHQSLFDGQLGTTINDYVPNIGNKLIPLNENLPQLNGAGKLIFPTNYCYFKLEVKQKINEFKHHFSFNALLLNGSYYKVAVYQFFPNGDYMESLFFINAPDAYCNWTYWKWENGQHVSQGTSSRLAQVVANADGYGRFGITMERSYGDTTYGRYLMFNTCPGGTFGSTSFSLVEPPLPYYQIMVHEAGNVFSDLLAYSDNDPNPII